MNEYDIEQIDVINRRAARHFATRPKAHKYRGPGRWNLGCECSNCARSRLESGGFEEVLKPHLMTAGACAVPDAAAISS